jgi:hypothetical protein
MKNRWLYLGGCCIAPHVMLVIGLFFISKNDLGHKTFGLTLCKWSTIALVIGSLAYYVFFTPITGFD